MRRPCQNPLLCHADATELNAISMNVLRTLIAPLVLTFAIPPISQGASAPFDFQKIAPKVTENVSELLERAHYSKRKLDDGVSKQLLKNYLERLDYNHLFFTQKDVDDFNAKYATTLDDDLRVGNTQPAVKIFDVYRKRVEDRVAKVKEQVKGNFDFDSTRAVEMNRSKSPWPKDEAEADQIWKDRIEGEMLDRKLMEDKVDPPVKVLTRRYDQLLRNIHEQGDEDVIAGFLSVLAETYDPHSEYMSRSQLDSFNINMSLQLVGIGAVLTSDEGYAKIRELVPGGPAAENGRLKVGDRISAVSQGERGVRGNRGPQARQSRGDDPRQGRHRGAPEGDSFDGSAAAVVLDLPIECRAGLGLDVVGLGKKERRGPYGAAQHPVPQLVRRRHHRGRTRRCVPGRR